MFRPILPQSEAIDKAKAIIAAHNGVKVETVMALRRAFDLSGYGVMVAEFCDPDTGRANGVYAQVDVARLLPEHTVTVATVWEAGA